jgi:hypothetical protein
MVSAFQTVEHICVFAHKIKFWNSYHSLDKNLCISWAREDFKSEVVDKIVKLGGKCMGVI